MARKERDEERTCKKCNSQKHNRVVGVSLPRGNWETRRRQRFARYDNAQRTVNLKTWPANAGTIGTKYRPLESYVAPRVSAVQSERRPNGQNGPIVVAGQTAPPLPLPMNLMPQPKRSDSTSRENASAPTDLSSFYNMYSDSPTMLPRTPLAPGKHSEN